MKQVKGKRTRRCRIFVLAVLVAGVGWVNVSTNLIPQSTVESLDENSLLINVLSQSIRATKHKDATKPWSMETPKGKRNEGNLSTMPEQGSHLKTTTTEPFQRPPLPKVQAWPDYGDVKPPKNLPPTDRKLFETIEDVLSFKSELELYGIRMEPDAAINDGYQESFVSLECQNSA